MGGWGSGRQYGRPTADLSKRIDLAWMLRTERAIPCSLVSGSLWWTCGGEHAGSIGYEADMLDLDNAVLRLNFTRGSGDDREHVKQTVQLDYTEPNYGGRRWWMICPFRHNRCGKLYLPNGGDRFAGRKAWRLGYHIQRVAHRDRSAERLFRLQKKLGGEMGVGQYPRRPKGMWRRTYERHLERYWELEEQADAELALLVLRLGGRF